MIVLIVAGLSSLLVLLPVSSASPVAVMEVCRAGVEPCQRDLNAPSGGPVALDLFISSSAPDQQEPPLNLVAWETHFSLAGDGELRLVTQPLDGQSMVGLPVRERGHPRYALEGFLRHEGETPNPDADYYTVQNRFNEETGQLDYSVTLLGSGKPWVLVPHFPGDHQARWLIGRIVLSGQSLGSIQVSPSTDAALPFQAISLSGSGHRLPVPLSASSPLATVIVGPPNGTLDLEGRVAGSSSMELVVTFWNP